MTAPELTRREREVASLVAEGLTNRQIAERLFISERTAESHVEQIRGKLGFRSRAQIAAWIAGESAPRDERRSPAVAVQPAAGRRRRWPVPAAIAAIGLAAALVAATALVAPALFTAPSASQPRTITLAGTGERGFSTDGALATRSALVQPLALAVAPDGDVYVTEGNRVRVVRRDGRIETLAGTGVAGSAGDGGPAAQAELDMPQGIAIDSTGAVYIADTLNNRVRKVGADGVIKTVAGTGEPGYSGDGGAALDARLSLPTGLTIGFGDSLLIADTGNNVVRQLGGDGVIHTFAGTGEPGYRGDGGPAAYAVFQAPGGLAFDDEGNLYIADALNERVRRVDVDGQVSTVLGTGDAGLRGDGGPAIFAALNLTSNPLAGMGQALAVTPRGEVLIADGLNHRVRRLDPDGRVSTVALFDMPLGVAVDPEGLIYVADAGANRVLRIG